MELQTNNPVLTLSHLSSFLPIAEGDHRRRFLEDLKAAGLPE